MLTSAAVVTAAVALAVAGFVVVRSFRNVRPEPLPPSLRTVPPDTALVAFRGSIQRKVTNLATRCASRRKQFGSVMTPLEDSLSRECDSAIALVRARIAALDTVARGNRKIAADSVKAQYERAKLKVRVFTRTGRGNDTLAGDSLDKEIQKLIGE
jgi:hypothetical protein